jgi:hypothetical protein
MRSSTEATRLEATTLSPYAVTSALSAHQFMLQAGPGYRHRAALCADPLAHPGYGGVIVLPGFFMFNQVEPISS